MTDLSPAAQAVLDAFTEDNSVHDWKHNHYNTEALAAAFRAVSDQFNSVQAMPGAPFCRNKLLAIANELEHIND
jgi:hypothetical protein